MTTLSKNKVSFLLYTIAILLNCISTIIVLSHHEPFNVDGILYINVAKAYLQNGFHAAIHTYPWPFYSILLAHISQIFHITLFQAGIILNLIFTSMIICSFLYLIDLLGGSHLEKIWGLFLILLYPYLNHDKINLLRDLGYYAFFLLSLAFFIRFSLKQNFSYAFLWQISLMIAGTFRIEGLIFLFITPLFIVFYPRLSFKNKIFNILKLYSLTIPLLLCGLFLMENFLHFGRLPEVFDYLNFNQFFNSWKEKISMQKQVLGITGQDNANIFLIGGLVGVFVYTLLNTLGLFNNILLALAAFYLYLQGHNKLCKLNLNIEVMHPWKQLQVTALAPLFTYMIIIVAILALFLFQQLFLTDRYILPLCLVIMLIFPWVLTALWNQTHSKNTARISIILLFLYSTIASFVHFGISKAYLINAGKWIAIHTSPQTRLYTNDPILAYYANRLGTNYPNDFLDRNWWNQLQKQNLKNYDYFAITLDHRNKIPSEQQICSTLQHTHPDIIFQNKRGDKALLFNFTQTNTYLENQ